MKKSGNERIMVVAPHPDDEVLGAGGTIARLSSEGAECFVVILTKGFTGERTQVNRRDALAAHKILGVHDTFFFDFPAAELDGVPHREINAALLEVVRKVCPTTLFLPFLGDIHSDHQVAFLSGMVAARPIGDAFPRRICAYETLSETNWNAPYVTPNFVPNLFVDIADHLDAKLEAFSKFSLQVKTFPHERSPETIRALATLRGSTVGKVAAEAFIVLREIL